MTLKFIEGFEGYDNPVDFAKVFPGSWNVEQITFPTTGRKAGTKCIDWHSVALDTAYMYAPINANTFESSEYAIWGFAFKFINWGSGAFLTEFFLDNDSQGGCSFYMGAGNNNIEVKRAGVSNVTIGVIPYEMNTWNYFEIKCKIGNGTDGHIVVRLNEQEVINWTGDNYYSGVTGFKVSRCTWRFKRYMHLLIDDMYFAGGNGSYNNDFLGDVRIDVINPNGAGNYTDLTPSAGNNYECVDEAIIDEADYVEGVTPGDKDSYTFPDVPTDLDDASIFGISLRNISQRTAGSDNIKIDALLRTGSTDYNFAVELSLADSWSSKDFIFEKDPSDVGDWTKAKINACEFGMEVA
jgi:hypothetical protein